MADDQKNVESGVHKKKDVAQESYPESYPIQNIVLFGKTGNGKSATGNSIIKQVIFDSKMHSSGVTMECQSVRVATPEGPILNVIDTPGLFDLSVEAEVICREIVRCLTIAEGGIHAAILVLSLKNRVTKEEEKVLMTLQKLFGDKIVDYLIIIFSAGDELSEAGQSLDDYLENCPKFLKRILKLCGQRKIVFDNKTKDEEKKAEQVHKLLKLIDLVREKNKNIPYTHDMYHRIKEENDRHKKEEKKLEAKGHSEEQLEALKKELEETKEASFKTISKLLEMSLIGYLRQKEKEKEDDSGCTIL